jgi:hypothetical protein
MSTLPRAKFEADRNAARLQAAITLAPVLKVDFQIAGWSSRTKQAILDQWNRKAGQGWDWDEIFRRHRDPDRLDIAIWSPQDRLSALALGLTSAESVEIRFLEGDPRQDCPLRGRRALIVLECAACYAQAKGRPELRVRPINERLATLYKQIYGFELATPTRGEAYYFKKV